ncbi:IRK-interacting protein-like [Dioscorea cayenensis subsp. rotundata]|uniref:IRK-interacting protein-like n=1 Tax=Dioscorea cayennensis subsp. rotundata TaxID=55577 RepID=A0AB40AZN3_DIOCR|nr:IRK-interacting protein-like [Dioscorea cayenensis subsp. rotundata]
MASKISREDVQAAVAKAMELRALHAALLHGSTSSPTVPRLLAGSSPSLARAPGYLSAEDYPVFTPSYGEESSNWRGIRMEEEEERDEQELEFSNNGALNKSYFPREEEEQLQHTCSEEDRKSNKSLCISHLSLSQNTPGTDVLPNCRRMGSDDRKLVTTGNKCKPEYMSGENGSYGKILKNDNAKKVPSSDIKNRGLVFSWFLPKGRRKPKSEMSPNVMESEDVSQLLKSWGMFSVDSLKKELLEANANKDAALTQVSDMKSTLIELKQKLVSLEAYCEELKKALKHALQAKGTQTLDRPNLSKRSKSNNDSRDNSMPVSLEVMVEGFLQIVSEARLSVKQFCKTLISLIEETDTSLVEKLSSELKTTSASKHSKAMLYHLEALVNQSLYQDFENCVFEKNGTPKVLDPHQDRIENFSAFVALRNLSWNEVLRKGTKYYSEDFSRFCDQKMSSIVSIIDWSRPWPEHLLQSFFVSAKCIWLLHLLAFSFNPPLMILRVEENRSFDPLYMEDVLRDKHRQAQASACVKFMVMPGFYVEDRVLRCRVLCKA